MSRPEQSRSPIDVRALQLAERKVGGLAALARHLHAPLDGLQRWISGNESTPRVYFVRSVDIIATDPQELSLPDAQYPRVWMDARARSAHLHGKELRLPLTEWAVLESLAARIGRVVAREQIRRELSLWTGKSLGDALQMHIFRLRLKIEPEGFFIRTFHGTGYMLQDAWMQDAWMAA